MSDPWEGDERYASLPLAEHTPRTAAQAGLALTTVPIPGWRLLLAASVAVGLLGIVTVVARSGSDSASVLELDLGTCFTPVINDIDEPVAPSSCVPGAARLVARERHPAEDDELHPGDGALELFGQGACQGRVDAERLVVVVPSPAAWAAGERVVACSERL